MSVSNSSLSEIDAAFLALSNYFSDQAQYLSTGGTPPNTAAINGLSCIELIGTSVNNSNNSADFSIGSSQESASIIVAIQREIAMATGTKSALYLSQYSELQGEADFYSSSGSFLSGVASGAPTNGSMS